MDNKFCRSKRANSTENSSTEDRIGVGGWLLYFCINLTILSPLISIAQILINVSKAKNSFQIVVMLILGCAPMIYSILTGIRLWMVRPNSYKQAKIFLIVNLGINLTIIALNIISGEKTSDQILNIFISVPAFAIWYCYLSFSVRVRNTYILIKKKERKKSRKLRKT